MYENTKFKEIVNDNKKEFIDAYGKISHKTEFLSSAELLRILKDFNDNYEEYCAGYIDDCDYYDSCIECRFAHWDMEAT